MVYHTKSTQNLFLWILLEDSLKEDKVTPDAKLPRASTSSSMDSGSTDESLVVNLMGRLNAATEESTLFWIKSISFHFISSLSIFFARAPGKADDGATASLPEGPPPSPEVSDSHPRYIERWIPGSWIQEGREESGLSSLPTVPFSPSAAEHIAVRALHEAKNPRAQVYWHIQKTSLEDLLSIYFEFKWCPGCSGGRANRWCTRNQALLWTTTVPKECQHLFWHQ